MIIHGCTGRANQQPGRFQSPKVSGLIGEYSRFRETAAGDLVRSRLPQKAGNQCLTGFDPCLLAGRVKRGHYRMRGRLVVDPIDDLDPVRLLAHWILLDVLQFAAVLVDRMDCQAR